MAAAKSSDGATVTLARSQVDAALASFGALTTSVKGAFTPQGARVDVIAEASLFAAAGLRAGDVITAIDGRPFRSLDDVAALYARASTAKLVTLQVLRGGAPMTLRVTIQ